jgi:predicted DNA binding CopG/RHH family protein
MKIDADEKELLESVERGEWKSAGGGKRERARFSRYAETTFKKDRPLNIRLSSKDLEAIQKRALAEGLPYQVDREPATQVRDRAAQRDLRSSLRRLLNGTPPLVHLQFSEQIQHAQTLRIERVGWCWCSRRVGVLQGQSWGHRHRAPHAFQACAFNHSAISPLTINDLRLREHLEDANCVRPRSVPQSLTRFSSIDPRGRLSASIGLNVSRRRDQARSRQQVGASAKSLNRPAQLLSFESDHLNAEMREQRERCRIRLRRREQRQVGGSRAFPKCWSR